VLNDNLDSDFRRWYPAFITASDRQVTDIWPPWQELIADDRLLSFSADFTTYDLGRNQNAGYVVGGRWDPDTAPPVFETWNVP